MNEDFIHYLWKFKKLSGLHLSTTTGLSIRILSLGTHNYFAGPDFFNARLQIDGQDWAGNVEMHVNASDWYLHGHDEDPAYDNVILHVVWNHDAEITRRDDINIPVLEVSTYVQKELVKAYRQTFDFKNRKFIHCENQIQEVSDFTWKFWLEKIYVERLESKSTRILPMLKATQNDWEAVFFQMLARSFGTKSNADAFEQVATSMEPGLLRRLARDSFRLEAVLLGQAGLLNQSCTDSYFKSCQEEYAFAKAKHQLSPCLTPMTFFRLRPANYPGIRLSQLAVLYYQSPLLFGEILLANKKEEIYQLFDIQASEYWDTHHVFGKPTALRKKKLTPAFIDLLIINCIVPVRFTYARSMGRDPTDGLLDLMYSVSSEQNKWVQSFDQLMSVEDALQSQAVLQLKSQYCDRNRCLHCDVGLQLLRNNNGKESETVMD
ncbi:DUF2851 family protein [Nonlabens xiamenensis]|uniref:DUF2851 family protein n=1 Tax=Nonlabens xiamenensis TaxID=2341043 RepID=UPI000F6135D8|nr:DUF2851 family protein [Nonlabens xiamenensis]